MCGHVQTLSHRYDTLLGPCVCSSGASRIHDYGMPSHRFHSRILLQAGMLTLQPIVYFPLSIRALNKRQSGNEYS
jgi:NO-binding membrane sensor protein with MHYT domain